MTRQSNPTATAPKKLRECLYTDTCGTLVDFCLKNRGLCM
jgi:hypothetical protein